MNMRMTVTEARGALPEVVARVQAGEEVTLTRHGEPVAVVVRPDRVLHRRAAAEQAVDEARKLGEWLESLQGQPLSENPGVTLEEAQAHIAEIRAGRDGR